MGDVSHVIDYVNANYASKGVQHESDGDGVVNFTMPPKIHGINRMIRDIESLDRVTTVTQVHDGTQLLFKVYVTDGNTVNLPSGTVVVDGAWVQSVFRAVQRYMTSTPVLICLLVIVVSYYRELIRSAVEHAYMKAFDQ